MSRKVPLIEELFKGKQNRSYPSVMVSGSGDAWYLNPDTRSMERIFRGSVVKQMTTQVDSQGRHLVKFGTLKILIPEEELFSIGDN
jgi:hypothetical protein|tara:strand:+ start:127 stop:384 length:258 start_codon:yes stop_codon:yes gene_type:complete